MDKRLETYFDENLREIPCDPEGLSAYVVELQESLKGVTEPLKRVPQLGRLGVYLRILGALNPAEAALREALHLVHIHKLGIQPEVVQKIRLGHILQWQKNFNTSNALFNEVLSLCRSGNEAGAYLDFALQHAGKNLFDQGQRKEALILFEEALSIRIKKGAPQEQIDSTKWAIQATVP